MSPTSAIRPQYILSNENERASSSGRGSVGGGRDRAGEVDEEAMEEQARPKLLRAPNDPTELEREEH